MVDSLESNLTVTRGEGCGEGIVTEFGMDVYTLLYLKWITNKDLLHCTGNSAQCRVAAWLGGASGEKGYCICVVESLCCPPETTALLTGSTPIQNKKYFFFK